jgi:hypothetical protein
MKCAAEKEKEKEKGRAVAAFFLVDINAPKKGVRACLRLALAPRF